MVGGAPSNPLERGHTSLLVESGVTVTTLAPVTLAGRGSAREVGPDALAVRLAGADPAMAELFSQQVPESIYGPLPDGMLVDLALDSLSPGGA